MLRCLKKCLGAAYDRGLSEGERVLARHVFGECLDLDRVRLKSAWWVLKGYAVAPNGNVYYHKDDWQEDFSCDTLSKRAWLIHELTHVWQVQQGMAVFWRALVNRQYSYIIEAGKPFVGYGIEQQASMVEDYYIAKTLGKDCSAFVCIPFFEHGAINDD